jgi:hypothetical protein
MGAPDIVLLGLGRRRQQSRFAGQRQPRVARNEKATGVRGW